MPVVVALTSQVFKPKPSAKVEVSSPANSGGEGVAHGGESSLESIYLE